MTTLLTVIEEVVSVLVEEELVQWRWRQQKAYIGAPEDSSLEKLEEWYAHILLMLKHIQISSGIAMSFPSFCLFVC